MIDETELLRLLRSGCAVTPHQIQAAKRIEELEQNLSNAETASDKYHHITDEQIDAAWAKANTTSTTEMANGLALAALAELNIHRCEECGGSGVDADSGVDVCPDCNGHGWIITSVDPNNHGQIGTDDG